MLELNNYRIIKYLYSLSNDELTIQLWDKMNFEETRWAVKLTLEGVNDSSSDDEYPAWDAFLVEPKLEEKISTILLKYNIEYVIEDLTDELLKDNPNLTEELTDKIEHFLEKNLTIDDVLDNIIEVGMENISIFEKYYLKKHKNE
jgi:hypothetical protein